MTRTPTVSMLKEESSIHIQHIQKDGSPSPHSVSNGDKLMDFPDSPTKQREQQLAVPTAPKNLHLLLLLLESLKKAKHLRHWTVRRKRKGTVRRRKKTKVIKNLKMKPMKLNTRRMDKRRMKRKESLQPTKQSKQPKNYQHNQ